MEKKKPKFLRKDWHKKIKLGSKTKSKRKWRFPIGIHNKIRLGRKGHSARPKIGWGRKTEEKELVQGLKVVLVSNVKDLENVKKGEGIMIKSVGKRKREGIIKAANVKKIKILNKYKKSKEKK